MAPTPLHVQLSCLRCPVCEGPLEARTDGIGCVGCSAVYPLRADQLDLLQEGPDVSPGRAGRLMQWPALARAYEGVWRPMTCALVTRASFARQVSMIERAFAGEIRGPLLDLGTGTGNFARALARKDPALAVLAADISAAMLAVAAAEIRRESLGNILVLRADAMRLPIRDGVVESVLCCGTLHLVADPGALIREVHRVLHPAGRFVCLTYIRAGGALQRRALAHSRRLFGMEFFDRSELESMLTRAGFARIRVETADLLTILSCAP